MSLQNPTMPVKVGATNWRGPSQLPPRPQLDGVYRTAVLPAYERRGSAAHGGTVRFLELRDIPIPLGLSNVLITLYVALSAAAMSNRVALLGGVPFSVACYEDLLDMPRMRESLRGLNMVWVTAREVKHDAALRALVAAAGPAAPFPALPATSPFHALPWVEYDLYLMGGDRMMKPWPEFAARYRNARLAAMRNVSRVGRVAMPVPDSLNTQNVGLGFVPLRHNLPFGVRFFFRHTVFHRRIRDMAQELMTAIGKRGVTKLMVVHLRIEWDGPAHDQPSSPASLRDTFHKHMGGLVNRTGVDGIYIVCGDMSTANEMALRSFTVAPVMFKSDFPEVVFPVKDDARGKQNPIASAVHALIAAHSSLYVSTTTHSTFLNLVSSMRCHPPAESTRLTRRSFQEIFRTPPHAPGIEPDAAALVDPEPGVGLSDETIPVGGFQTPNLHHRFGQNFLHWQNYGLYTDVECPGP
jgi:hypothetical protein